MYVHKSQQIFLLLPLQDNNHKNWRLNKEQKQAKSNTSNLGVQKQLQQSIQTKFWKTSLHLSLYLNSFGKEEHWQFARHWHWQWWKEVRIGISSQLANTVELNT
jgi:hypothetical protein